MHITVKPYCSATRLRKFFNSYELFYTFSKVTGQAVYNRGISGDTSDRLLERLKCNALNITPKNLVILIGTNDIGKDIPPEYTLKNIQDILSVTHEICPNTNVILQAIYPVNSMNVAYRKTDGRQTQ